MKRPALKNFRRIVVKVGSSLLIDSGAGEVRSAWLAALAADIAKLHGEGRDVLVVSSGSIALGRSRRHALDGWKLRARFTVRGHWRNQAHGPGRALRMRKWIAPFWKGPAGAEAWAHIYKDAAQ